MYAIAPEKWSPPTWDNGYVYYKENEDSYPVKIMMSSFYSLIRLWTIMRRSRKQDHDQLMLKQRALLLKSFQDDINKYYETMTKTFDRIQKEDI